MIRSPRALLALVLAMAAVAGCSDDDNGGTGPDGIERADVVGAYEPTTFLTTFEGETTDQLDAGAELTLTLAADGTTDGRLFVPDGAEDGGDFDESLAGTWSFDEAADRVTFQMAADTFVRDIALTAVRAGGTIELRGDDTFGDVRIELVLRRTS